MAYFNSLPRPIVYNGVTYQPGQEIPVFGTGKYDDIMLSAKQVESNGVGNGYEDRIAHQFELRKIMYDNYESERREEDNYFSDMAKYRGELDRR